MSDKPKFAELLGLEVAAGVSCETPIQYQVAPEVVSEWLDLMAAKYPDSIVVVRTTEDEQ